MAASLTWTSRQHRNGGRGDVVPTLPSFIPCAFASPHELVAKSLAVRLNQPRGGRGKVDRQHKAAGTCDLAEKAPARARRLVGVPIEDRRPARLAALQR